jgi:dockerin type I repeat protein
MPEHVDHPEGVDEPALPAGLVEALGGLHRRGVPEVPGEIDRAVLREARAGYHRRRRFWVAARAIGAAAAVAAAAIVVIVVYVDRRHSSPTPVAGTQAAQPGDIDGNGRVDILDAFLLAKKVEAKAPAAPGDDVNGDGVVDRADVDRVAGWAVRVEAPGKS